MACHLPAWPPVGTTGASLMTSSSTVAAWFLATANFGATVAGQSVMGLCPCSTSQCWLSTPISYVEPELTAEAHRHPKMAAAKAEDLQRAFAVCCIRCPCPYLHAWVVFPPFIGLPFLHFYAIVSSWFLLFVCFYFFLSIATMSFAGSFLVRSLLSAFPAYLRTFFWFDLVRFRLSCVHGWIRSGSVNGAFRDKALRFCRGGMGIKYPPIRSEKIMTASVGCALHMLLFFFFLKRVLSGFNWFQINPLGKLRKRRKRECSEKLPGFEKSSDRAENFRVG